MPECILRLVRHGESDWNEEGLIQGHNDTSRLTTRGREQAMQCGETLIGAGVEVIISSDLQRASETAEIIKRALDVELLKTPLLRERSFGQLEGKTNSLLTAENFGIEKNLVVNADARIPGGESLNDLLRRVTEFLAWLELNYRGRSVLLVTHSGTVRALRVAYSQGSFKDLDWGEVPNCSVWELGA